MDLRWDTAGIHSCTMDTTEACNLACTYCFTWGRTNRRLSEEMGKRIIDFFLDHLEPQGTHPYNIGWWGGEPLLEWKLIKKLTLYGLDEFSKRKLPGNLTFGGTTNGLLLDEEKLKFLGDHNGKMLVSWDGVKEVHDKYRVYKDGRGSFDDLEKKIMLALRYWPDLKLRFALSRRMVGYIVKSVIWAYNQGVRSILFSPVFEEDWTDEDFVQLKDQLIALAEFLNSHPEMHCKHMSDALMYASQSYPCGAGRSYVGFAVDGKIYPCHRFNKYGDKEHSEKWCIGNVWDGFNEKRQVFLDYPEIRVQQCGDCTAYRRCAGGCYAVHVDLAGDLFQIIPKFCKYTRILYEVGIQHVNRHEIMFPCQVL